MIESLSLDMMGQLKTFISIKYIKLLTIISITFSFLLNKLTTSI